MNQATQIKTPPGDLTAGILDLPEGINEVNDLSIVVPDECLRSPFVAAEDNLHSWIEQNAEKILAESFFLTAAEDTIYRLGDLPVDSGICELVLDIVREVYLRTYDTHSQRNFNYRVPAPFDLPTRINLSHADGYDSISVRIHKVSYPLLEDLALPVGVYEMLMSDQLNRGGVGWFIASQGQGKSTTMVATIASRLRAFGGVAKTIELPIEIPLGRWHGEKGVCDQFNALKEEIDERVEDVSRQFPSGGNKILMVGEVNSPETARMVMNLGMNGMFVLATVHGSSVANGLNRVISMAASANGIDAARLDMAQSLKFALHQKISMRPEGRGWGSRKYTMQVLHLLNAAQANKAGKIITSGNIDELDRGVSADYARRLVSILESRNGARAFPLEKDIPDAIKAMGVSDESYKWHQIGCVPINELDERERQLRMDIIGKLLAGELPG